jgi:hypothetical protein
VIGLDTMWFGNFLKPHPKLTVIKGDVRDIDSIDLAGIDAIIHLSSVANDPCYYCVNSDRLLATGFRPKKTVADAIQKIIAKYRTGELKDEEHGYNLKWMQKGVIS